MEKIDTQIKTNLFRWCLVQDNCWLVVISDTLKLSAMGNHKLIFDNRNLKQAFCNKNDNSNFIFSKSFSTAVILHTWFSNGLNLLQEIEVKKIKSYNLKKSKPWRILKITSSVFSTIFFFSCVFLSILLSSI